jgi:hypothetical protein
MNELMRVKRLPLRDLLNHVDRRCRELVEHLTMDTVTVCAELHDTSRAKRKKSSFPTVRTLVNQYDKVRKTLEYASNLQNEILECSAVIQSKVEDAKHSG